MQAGAMDRTRAAVAVYAGLLGLALAAANLLIDWHSDAGQAIGSLAVMWSPALAALLACLATRYPLRGFGWRPGPVRWLLIAYLIAAAYGTLPFVIDAAAEHGAFTAEHMATYPAHFGLPPSVWLGPLMLAVIEPLFGMIAATGEEIGWRGFLLPALLPPLGFWRAVALSWAMWLAFHLPGMVDGNYHGAGTPLWFSFACFAAMLFAATVILSVLRIVSGSLWPCAVAHAVHNLYTQEIAPSALSGGPAAPWLVGEFGALTVATGAAAALLLLGAVRGRADAAFSPPRAG